MKRLGARDVEAFKEQGFHIARGVFAQSEISRLRQGYAYIQELAARTDLPEDILQGKGDVHIHLQTPEPMAGPAAVQFLRKVQWPALIHPAFEEIRTSARFPALLEPLIGTCLNLKGGLIK